MIGINKNNNDYIVIKSTKLADLISNYQQIITGIEFIINNYKGYYVIYGDGTLIDKIDNYYTTDIHPSTYDTVVSPKLNRYKIKMSKYIMTFKEALSWVISVHKKITCSYFHDEYLTVDNNGNYVVEDGYAPDAQWFTTAQSWNADWWIVE